MNNKSNATALVVLSGGQDSATCLGLCLQQFSKVEAIAFDYGQRHAVELACAGALCAKHNVNLHLVDLRAVLPGLVPSALLQPGSVADPHPLNKDLPASFVPVRNALFLVLAHGYAQAIGAGYIYTGVCQTDFSGYPDCRDVFIRSMQAALALGYNADIPIVTPLMYKDKAETFAIADSAGFLEDVVELTHTCYEGDHETRNPWGYGCGTCPACKLRSAGWDRFQAIKRHQEKA